MPLRVEGRARTLRGPHPVRPPGRAKKLKRCYYEEAQALLLRGAASRRKNDLAGYKGPHNSLPLGKTAATLPVGTQSVRDGAGRTVRDGA